MKIEQFVANLKAGIDAVEASRSTQLETEAGSAENRRSKDALAALMVERPHLVAQLLVRAWETAEIVADPLGTDTALGNTLQALGAEPGV